MQKLAEFHDDAINVAGDIHTILYEDEKIRVLKVVVKPGKTAAMHWHPRNINYILRGGKLEFTKPDGSTALVSLESDTITSSIEEVHHAVKNNSTETVETLQVELKS